MLGKSEAKLAHSDYTGVPYWSNKPWSRQTCVAHERIANFVNDRTANFVQIVYIARVQESQQGGKGQSWFPNQVLWGHSILKIYEYFH